MILHDYLLACEISTVYIHNNNNNNSNNICFNKPLDSLHISMFVIDSDVNYPKHNFDNCVIKCTVYFSTSVKNNSDI